MDDYRNGIILFFVMAYMLACVAIGVWAKRRTKTSQDFFMAGRNLGVLITGVAMFSSIMSGFGFVGGPGLVYRWGLTSFWILASTPIGFCVAYFLLAKRLRLLAEARGSVSLSDIAAARFRSRPVRLLTAVSILCGVIAYLAVQLKAMATVLKQIAEANHLPGADSLIVWLLLSCAVLVFYCVMGGIIASVYSDLFQGGVMVVAAVLIFVTASLSVEGGFAGMSLEIMQDDPEAASPWGTRGMFACLSLYLLFALGIAGQPHVVTKMMMSRDVRDARFTLPITLIGYTLAALLWISIGYAMRTLVLQDAHASLPNADRAAAAFLQKCADPILAGVVFAGLFAAIMSTADGFLNIGSAAVAHDIPLALNGRELKHEFRWAKVSTVLLTMAAAGFVLIFPQELIAVLGMFGWGVFASGLVPVVAFGLNWKRASAPAACVSILASLLINALVAVAKLTATPIPYGIDGGAIALLTSTTLFVGISLCSTEQPLDPDVEAVMDL